MKSRIFPRRSEIVRNRVLNVHKENNQNVVTNSNEPPTAVIRNVKRSLNNFDINCDPN